jgi:hypothetical protein
VDQARRGYEAMVGEQCGGGCARREEEAAAVRGESRAARRWRGLQNRRANEMKRTGKRERTPSFQTPLYSLVKAGP